MTRGVQTFFDFSEDIKNYIKTNFGDVDTWITTQIEASINTLKTTNSKA